MQFDREIRYLPYGTERIDRVFQHEAVLKIFVNVRENKTFFLMRDNSIKEITGVVRDPLAAIARMDAVDVRLTRVGSSRWFMKRENKILLTVVLAVPLLFGFGQMFANSWNAGHDQRVWLHGERDAIRGASLVLRLSPYSNERDQQIWLKGYCGIPLDQSSSAP
jgi:hypothetical protein